MTRDEATNVLFRNAPASVMPNQGHADAWIDAFAKLGMLKLDEPEDAMKLFYEAMIGSGASINVEWLFRILDKAGLKVVQK